MSTLLTRSVPGGLLACLLVALPSLSAGHDYGYGPGRGYQHGPRPIPQSPLVGVPPTYIAPGTLPPTYIAPGSLPPWAAQPVPPPHYGAQPQFTIPADPGLSQRRLLDEELRLRGYDNGRWQNNAQGQQWNDMRPREGRGYDPSQPGYRSGYGPAYR
jgi:hypothetical protein